MKQKHMDKTKNQLLEELKLSNNKSEMIKKYLGTESILQSLEVIDEYTKLILENYSERINSEGLRLLSDIRINTRYLESRIKKLILLTNKKGI